MKSIKNSWVVALGVMLLGVMVFVANRFHTGADTPPPIKVNTPARDASMGKWFGKISEGGESIENASTKIEAEILALEKERDDDKFMLRLLELTHFCNGKPDQVLRLCMTNYIDLAHKISDKRKLAEMVLNLYSLGYSDQIFTELERVWKLGAIDRETYLGEVSRLIVSGSREDALRVLSIIGSEKSPRALEVLTFILASDVSPENLDKYDDAVRQGVENYLKENVPGLSEDPTLLGVSTRVAYEDWIDSMIKTRPGRSYSDYLSELLRRGFDDPRRLVIIYLSPQFNSREVDGRVRIEIHNRVAEFMKNHVNSPFVEYFSPEQRLSLGF